MSEKEQEEQIMMLKSMKKTFKKSLTTILMAVEWNILNENFCIRW